MSDYIYELFIKALKSLPEQSGSIDDVFTAMFAIDKVASRELILLDLLDLVKEAVCQKHLTYKYNNKLSADILKAT
jgi:hypothetical protein